MPKLSIVIPAYQDEFSIHANFLSLKSELDLHVHLFSYEIILVNDGSPDNTILALEEIHNEFPGLVGVVNLTRNFGQVAAIYAGLGRCTGDCAVVISSDLQDPPELIAHMFRCWLNGAKTVIGVRESREDSSFSKITSRLFYRLMQRYALPSIPTSGFDFFLIDRSVLARLLNSTEQNGFLQGQILSASSKVVQLPYKRRARKLGKSGWTPLRKLKYFVDGFVAYSFVPIRSIALLGLLVFVLAVLLSFALVLQRLLFGTEAPGWSSVMIALLVLHGFELLAIGIVGEYVWRALDQVRPRPLYSVDYFKPPVTETRE
ncbi:MAG TPA: glycosyltransferase family 2 protein [Bryobacteraceae bacterium]|jgi:dolichol-phosphate mannosyltransferase|nr:glycosyltransferase family 2 protein [Bryobacteraceae bacterium]